MRQVQSRRSDDDALGVRAIDTDPAYHRRARIMDAQELLNQQEWEQPENWTGPLSIYRSQRDTRLWVPKRNPAYGWTLNFAHRDAWTTLLGLLIVPIALLVLLPLLLLIQ